ncbi:hypothetical protein SLA2020_113500 [Shorea laevis]
MTCCWAGCRGVLSGSTLFFFKRGLGWLVGWLAMTNTNWCTALTMKFKSFKATSLPFVQQMVKMKLLIVGNGATATDRGTTAREGGEAAIVA